jgi:CBS domain-containing protein
VDKIGEGVTGGAPGCARGVATMDLMGRARRVRIYVNEGDKVGWRPAHFAVLELLRRENAQGATVLRGVEGFGAAGQIHVSHLVDVAQDLPIVVEWIDSPEVVERLIGRVKELVPRGLITMDETEILLHQPRPVRDLPAALTAGDVMSRQVTSVTRDAPLRDVVELMLGKVYRALPVVEAGVPVGIITNSDLVRKGGLGVRVELLASLDGPEVHAILEKLASTAKVASDVMTPDPVTVEARTPLPRVAELMTRRRLKRLPVVDGHAALLGMVSRVDLLRTASGGPERTEPAPRELGLAGDVPLSTVMRRDAPVVHPDTPLPEVLQAVISTRLNRALVVDADHRVVGLVTDAELLERLTPSLRPGVLRSLVHRLPFAHPSPEERSAEQHARAKRASDLMTRDVATATEGTRLSEAIGIVLKGNHKVLAVTDASGALVGMVDRADLLHGLAPHE